MKYKVGNLVEIKGRYTDFKGIGKVVEVHSDGDLFIELPKEYWGRGHNGHPFTKAIYTKNNYYWFKPFEIIRKVKLSFAKDDLKAGMLVQYRNGDLRLVMDSKKGLYLTSKDCFHHFNYYDDSLLDMEGDTELDIVKVYDLVNDSFMALDDLFKVEYRKLLWEREEPAEEPVEEMTLEEVCKAVGKTIKVVKG